MELGIDDIRILAKTIGLEIPEEDMQTVLLRLSSLLVLMDRIECDLGDEMDKVDPVPPVYPREEF